MNIKQAIQTLQEMVNNGVLTGEEELGAFTNGGETFLPTAEFKTFKNPGEAAVVYMRFFTDVI